MPIYAFRKFHTEARIFEVRGNSLKRLKDKCRLFQDARSGDSYHRLKKLKINTVPIAYDYINTTSSGKQFVYMFSPAPLLYFPFELTEKLQLALKAGNVAEVEKELPRYIKRFIRSNDDQTENIKKSLLKLNVWRDWFGFRLYKNYAMTDPKGTFEKMLPMLAVVMTMIVMGVAVFIMFQGMEGMVDRIGASEARWNTLNERFMDQNDQLLNLVETGRVPIDTLVRPPPGV